MYSLVPSRAQCVKFSCEPTIDKQKFILRLTYFSDHRLQRSKRGNNCARYGIWSPLQHYSCNLFCGIHQK